MDTFAVGSDPVVSTVFHSRSFDKDGWLDSYIVEIKTRNFRASARVENPGFGHPPSQLFEDLSANWKGWLGTKDWYSMEGELEIRATSDGTGHISLAIKFPGHNSSSEPWSAEVQIMIEAGQLERLANDANEFFGKRVI